MISPLEMVKYAIDVSEHNSYHIVVGTPVLRLLLVLRHVSDLIKIRS